MEAKGIGRKILDKVQETYQSDLGAKYFAYDGEKTLFTVGALPSNKLDFSVVLEEIPSSRCDYDFFWFFFPCEISRLFPFLQSLICFDILFICRNHAGNDTNDADRKRSRRPNQTKKFMVEISYAAKIPMQAIASALQGKETENLQDALRVLDIILRQSAARQ